MSSKGAVRGWTPCEDAILKEYYPIGGCKLCKEKGLNKKLSTIRMRARSLGVKGKYRVWTDEEIKTIRDLSEQGATITGIQRELNHRSILSISKKIESLGIVLKPKWSEKDLKLLKEYYPEGGSKLVKSKGVEKSTRDIASKARTLGLKLKNQRVQWTDEEVAILMQYYNKEGLSIFKRLEGKTIRNVINKLNNINTGYRQKYSHWTDEEQFSLKEQRYKSDEELIELYSSKPKEEVIDLVNYYRWRYVGKL